MVTGLVGASASTCSFNIETLAQVKQCIRSSRKRGNWTSWGKIGRLEIKRKSGRWRKRRIQEKRKVLGKI